MDAAIFKEIDLISQVCDLVNCMTDVQKWKIKTIVQMVDIRQYSHPGPLIQSTERLIHENRPGGIQQHSCD